MTILRDIRVISAPPLIHARPAAPAFRPAFHSYRLRAVQIAIAICQIENIIDDSPIISGHALMRFICIRFLRARCRHRVAFNCVGAVI
ncbi:hypothetical protein [Paraburkholderia fynbosensis]|uniref:hypothetical protein n=1 Tax=Paraburkholderia fynbosensis TaxID=1200993 RepID=UPI0015817C70|nr:hypothetical protein [Paraburkholderia fynbosensis]